MKWKENFPQKYRYFETDNGILYIGDSFEIVKLFPDNFFDLILTDPPYEISREHNFDTMKDRKNKRTGTYFGKWDEKFDMSIWNELTKKINKNGSIISFMAFEQFNEFKQILENNNYVIKDKIIWEKTNPFPRNRDRRYIPNIELIVWSVKKGAKWVFNRQNEKYEKSVLSFPTESGGGFKRYHPTQKPIALIKYLLKIHSNENNFVFDPFAGSGTTLLASERLNRRWIGIEIEDKYCEIIKQRIQNELEKRFSPTESLF